MMATILLRGLLALGAGSDGAADYGVRSRREAARVHRGDDSPEA